jgi:hypothetical protein
MRARVRAVGIEVSVHVTCDACRVAAVGLLVVDKLRPAPSLHVRLPEGWSATTRAESGDLTTICARCLPDAAARTMRVASIEFVESFRDSRISTLPGRD